MRVDFFRVEGSSGGMAALRALQRALTLNGDERTRDLVGIPYRLHELDRLHNRYWHGDFVLIRMNDVPVICSRDGATYDEMELEEDEGIGEETAFCYDELTQVLAIQSHRYSMKSVKWGAYLSDIDEQHGAIIPIAVPAGDAMKVIEDLSTVTRIRVRYAGLVNQRPAVGGTTDAIYQLANTAPYFELVLSAGRTRRHLSLGDAKRFLKKCYRLATGQRSAALEVDSFDGVISEVDAIDVKGRAADDSRVDTSLLKYLLRMNVDVPVDPQSRRMVYDDRRNGVKEAFEEHLEYLEQEYRR